MRVVCLRDHLIIAIDDEDLGDGAEELRVIGRVVGRSAVGS